MTTAAWKEANAEKLRKWRREHYSRNKEQYLTRNREKKDRLRELLNELKSKPCMDCGQSYPPYVMDFDHRDPATKLCNPSVLVNRGSLKVLKEEVAKCDLVCSNCHRIRTHGLVE